MSGHFNSLLMNDVLIRLEEQSFFADIGEERTLRFVQDSLALSRHHDGNPGEALAGVGQRLGICYYCWDRGTDLRQGICRDCRAADSIGIDSDDAEVSPPREAALSYGFIYQETIRDVLGFLPEKLTRDLDTSNRRKLPGDCIDSSLREIHVRFGLGRGVPAGQAATLGNGGADDRGAVTSIPGSGAAPAPIRVDAERLPAPQQ